MDDHKIQQLEKLISDPAMAYRLDKAVLFSDDPSGATFDVQLDTKATLDELRDLQKQIIEAIQPPEPTDLSPVVDSLSLIQAEIPASSQATVAALTKLQLEQSNTTKAVQAQKFDVSPVVTAIKAIKYPEFKFPTFSLEPLQTKLQDIIDAVKSLSVSTSNRGTKEDPFHVIQVDSEGKPVTPSKNGTTYYGGGGRSDTQESTLLQIRDSVKSDYAVRIDEATADITYIGKAVTGSANSASLWQIMKLDESTGLVLTWAGGASTFTNIWNNRTLYTYT
jgi:hypothetical protein